MADSPQHEEPPADVVPGPSVRNLRVLVVADNLEGANQLSAMIRSLGNDVRTANRGKPAIEIAAEFVPHVVFIDLSPPHRDGFATARRIRELPEGPGMVLVALMGWGQPKARDYPKALKFDHRLLKPVDQIGLRLVFATVKPTDKSS